MDSGPKLFFLVRSDVALRRARLSITHYLATLGLREESEAVGPTRMLQKKLRGFLGLKNFDTIFLNLL